jgi:3-methylcrotonyl-CoA carboxylase alpha subunit
VAAGEALPKRQDELSINGHAIEARLYAEDPAKGFLPSTGRLDDLWLSQLVRIERGVERGDTITPYYDPMIAKLVAHEPTRDAAAQALARACDTIVTWPVRNNGGFLAGLLRHLRFLSGTVTTDFIALEGDALVAEGALNDALLPVAGAQLFRLAGGSISALDEEDFPRRAGEIWSDLLGFRLNRAVRRTLWVRADGVLREAEIGTQARGNSVGGSIIRGVAEERGVLIVDRGWPHLFELDRTDGVAGVSVSSGAILAPMPGRIIVVEVREGQTVTKGQKLVTLEAMKMEHSLTAPFDGTVAELKVTQGDQVQLEALLARIEPATPA